MITELSLKKEQEKLHNINTNYILETNVLSKDICKRLIKYINLFKRKNLGRNAKCYCESGKKYKKCCLNKDFDKYKFDSFTKKT